MFLQIREAANIQLRLVNRVRGSARIPHRRLVPSRFRNGWKSRATFKRNLNHLGGCVAGLFAIQCCSAVASRAVFARAAY